MSTSDKRRGASHAIRTTTSTSTSSRNSGSSIIAPPPRAQLTGSASSPAVAQEADGIGGSAHEPGTSSASNKDGGGVSASASASKEKDKDRSTTPLLLLLREKDERIAALERELAAAAAEAEPESARELDRPSRRESEAAEAAEAVGFWQARHSALHRQYLRADTELRLLRAEADDGARAREAERRELRRGWDALLLRRDEEIRALRAHLGGMKRWVSASTRADQQASDEEFGGAAARLGNGLQNWVIMHFRRAKLDFTKADPSVIEDLGQLVPMYEEIEAHAKLHLLQSIVSSILVEMVFNCYFVGLSGEQAKQLQETERFLASMGSPEAVNQWRAMTLTLLRKDASTKLQQETTAVVTDVVSRVNRILDTITDTNATDARDQALHVLVDSSVELARLLVTQKAVFKVTMPKVLPHQRIIFDASYMDDIGGEEDDSLTAREICCVTFPGITKFGDENGGHPQFRNIIAKARVLCSPE